MSEIKRLHRQAICGLLVVSLLAISGCTGMQSVVQDTRPSAALAGEFAQYKEIAVKDEAAVKAYEAAPDLSNVINGGRFNFSSDALELLMNNGFVVLPGMGHEYFMVYEINRYDSIPNFITTDAVLHNYHLYYSHLLKKLEKDLLIPELKALNKKLLQQAEKDLKDVKGTGWENAALRNLAFIGTASILLDPAVKIPETVKSEVEQELELIKSHYAADISPVMSIGRKPDLQESLKEDYTQYIPRGHYAGTPELEKYFQTMMWYGRITFRLKDLDETRSAILLSRALQDGAGREEWEKIYAVTSFMAGNSDDIGYVEYAQLLNKIYGDKVTAKELAANDKGLDEFMAQAKKLKPPVINSIPIFDANIQPDREKEIAGFRLMGQRYSLDGEIFQHLIYREVEENPAGVRRMLPSGLDIPAAMGSETAEKILNHQGAFAFKNYQTNLSKMQKYIKDLKNQWKQDLYWSWLYTLLPLTEEKPEGYPSFMRNDAWNHKELATFLGSWAELKHDTILYTKQVYAEMGGGGMEEIDDRGYVEPNPHLYGRLASLAAMTRDGLKMRGLLDELDENNLTRLYDMAVSLKTISEKELINETLTEEEYELIRTFGGQLEHFWMEAYRDDGLQSPSQLSDFPAMLIADVATNPPAEVLEVGTGYIDSIYAVVPVDGTLRIAKGGVYSYYEFPWSASDRLTDQKWREMLYNNKNPDIPEWTSVYRTNGTAEIKMPGSY